MTATPTLASWPHNVSSGLGPLLHAYVVNSSANGSHADVSISIMGGSHNTSGLGALPGLEVSTEGVEEEAKNETSLGPPFSLTVYSQEHLISTSVVLGIMVLCCIIGNCFVIAAVILERSLHHVANYLILSLAVADLMVAVLVMPLSVVAEISQVWFLHSEVCHMWISFDVLCCTASILHLVAIAMDRYWAVTSIDYMRRRSAKRILLMILAVWVVALTISIPPLFGWRDPNNDPDVTGNCIISQDHGYTVFSTVGAFYLPMFVMICIYTRIYMVARRRIRKEKFNKRKKNGATSSGPGGRTVATEQITLAVTQAPPEYSVVSNCNGCSPEKEQAQDLAKNGLRPSDRQEEKNRSALDLAAEDKHDHNVSPSNGRGGGRGESYTNGIEADPPTMVLHDKAMAVQDGARKPCLPSSRQREKLEQKRERKAARTLAIITGAFLLCWLPFFIMALVGPFIRQSVEIPPIVDSLMLWLGYLNSLLNPIIYTIFSPEFRNAFQKILFGKYSRRNRMRGR